MILTEEDINAIIDFHLSNEPVRGYTIRINGETFRTSAGKILWKKKHHAIAAFKNTLEYRVKGRISTKLYNQGFSMTEVYDSDEYRYAWHNFMKYLEDNNMIQIVEMEW